MIYSTAKRSLKYQEEVYKRAYSSRISFFKIHTSNHMVALENDIFLLQLRFSLVEVLKLALCGTFWISTTLEVLVRDEIIRKVFKDLSFCMMKIIPTMQMMNKKINSAINVLLWRVYNSLSPHLFLIPLGRQFVYRLSAFALNADRPKRRSLLLWIYGLSWVHT